MPSKATMATDVVAARIPIEEANLIRRLASERGQNVSRFLRDLLAPALAAQRG